MDVIRRLVSETKTLASKEEQLAGNLTELKRELFMEEQSLTILEKDLQNLVQQTSDIQSSIDEFHSHDTTLMSSIELIKRFSLIKFFLKSSVDKLEPNLKQQTEMLNKLQEDYAKMLSKYENSLSYQTILQEEAAERELSKLIIEKRNEIMRVETTQDHE